jgi:1,2-diacylglycerol 3-beta-galactosyltransferase
MIGGGEGMGPLVPAVQAIAERKPDACLVVIAGRNQTLYNALQALDAPVPVHVEGFVTNIAVWMRAADVLVTKAGPNTLAEAFIAGLPLVLYAAIPGQEEGNVLHVVENDAGVWAPKPQAAADAVMDLLADPAQRAAMAARSLALARPHATEEIARHLWDLKR